MHFYLFINKSQSIKQIKWGILEVDTAISFLRLPENFNVLALIKTHKIFLLGFFKPQKLNKWTNVGLLK